MLSIEYDSCSYLGPSKIESIEEFSSISTDTNDSLPFPEPPSCVTFQQQAQSIMNLKESVAKLFDTDKIKPSFSYVKKNSVRHWHLARHVFRSGLVFAPSRRASDSIIPVLMKTRMVHFATRTESLDSTYTQTPSQTLIDYLSHKDEENVKLIQNKTLVKRTVSDIVACTQRNELNDTIAQYETIMRHLKNYDKFMTAYPMPSPSPLRTIQKPKDVKEILKKAEENLHQNSTNKSSIRNTQTQSLTRNTGRTFTEFVMSDLLSSLMPKPSSKRQPYHNAVHRASQTEFLELSQQNDAAQIDEADEVINELDDVLNENNEQQIALTPNSEINVIILNSPTTVEEQIVRQGKQQYNSIDIISLRMIFCFFS